MSFETFVTVIATLLSLAVVAAVTAVVVKGVRKFKVKRLMKTVKKILEKSAAGQDLVMEINKDISIGVKAGFIISDVIIDGNEYDSIKEALIYEPVSAFRRHQLLKLEQMIDDAYILHKKQVKQTTEVKHEEAVITQEMRKDMFVRAIPTGHIAGTVHIYKPCDFIVSDFIKATIEKDKDGYFTISKVFYAPEGNVRAASVLVPFDVLDADGKKTDKYVTYIESQDQFTAEVEAINQILKNMDHYNTLLEADRLVFDKDGNLAMVTPGDAPVKEEKKADPKTEAKEKVEELVELDQVIIS